MMDSTATRPTTFRASLDASAHAPGAPAPRRRGDILGAWIRHEARKRRERRIVASFAELHPDWHASLFDATFLATVEARQAIELRDAGRLALAWTRQFRYVDETTLHRDVRVVTTVASDFLAIHDGVMCSSPA